MRTPDKVEQPADMSNNPGDIWITAAQPVDAGLGTICATSTRMARTRHSLERDSCADRDPWYEERDGGFPDHCHC
jgi:hypothetical protein